MKFHTLQEVIYMKKRWISAICTSALMVGLLAGCGGTGVDLPKEGTVDAGEDKGGL